MRTICWLILSVGLIQGCANQFVDRENTDLGESPQACMPIDDVRNELVACYTKLKRLERGSQPVDDRAQQLDVLRDKLDSAEQQIQMLKRENKALHSDINKKDEAIRRLREVTLGAVGDV